MIKLIYFLMFITCVESNNDNTYFRFGTRKGYRETEDIHICIDNFYETCNRDAIKELLFSMRKNSKYTQITDSLETIEKNSQLCLIDTELRINECYDTLLNDMKIFIENNKDITSYDNYIHALKGRLKHCKKEMNKSCRTSSFVIDSIRSCTNDAIASYYKEVYGNVKGGQSSKSDINNALVSLQQYTIESKDYLVTGIEFIGKLDLLMDRLTFCSEQINKIEAVGI